ncbi:MAG: phytanoyl-CoA dioxygenase family protein [Armatimonadota bacterium]
MSISDPPPRRGLSRSERLRFDALGFVVLKGALSRARAEALHDALIRLRSEPDLAAHGVYINRDAPHFWHVGNLVAYDELLRDYATDPYLISCVRQVVGGDVRLEESEAILNRRDPALPDSAWDVCGVVPVGFHIGAEPGWGTWEEGGRLHCLFVKTLAFLTDVGPDDGGTAVIPGSHRVRWGTEAIVEAVRDDPSIAVQLTAEAGDVVLFAESLVHSSTEIRSTRDRAILVSGYTPPMLREWPGNEIPVEYLARQEPRVREVLSGGQSWHWRRERPGGNA